MGLATKPIAGILDFAVNKMPTRAFSRLLLLLLLLLLLPHSLEGPSLWCVHLKALTDGQR
jgi:hypothetical protein